MNLFYPQPITVLRQLVDTADKSLSVHNIVIDYDGEVIIDPEKKFNGINLKRFKYCTQINDSVKNNSTELKSLYQTLLQHYPDRMAA